MNVKRTPAASGLRFEASNVATKAFSLGVARGGKGGLVPGTMEVGGVDVLGIVLIVKLSPVKAAHIRRMVAERHKIILVARAGLECQVKKIVPVTSTIRLVVIILMGGIVNNIHKGVMRRTRMKRVVRAGLVVAEVAVL